MDQNHADFLKNIRTFIPKDRIYTDELRCLSWGTDAGFYRLIPQIVVRSDNEEEVSRLLKEASRLNVPVTFRAAGTSLSAQAITDSVLIVAGKHWEKYSLSPDRETITMQPGLVGGQVNKILAKYGRYFGPDPASVNSCMVGGIVMNNASGMSCGTHANSDRELLDARIVFADGTVLDTSSKDSREAFSQSHPDFLKGIKELRDEIRADKDLTDRIKYKYSIKNVTGLNLAPFVRFDDPFDIIAHLLVGSEGTLAFLSQVTMKTLPLAKCKASAMIYFADIREAARAVVALKSVSVSAVELLDKRSLASMDDKTGPNLTALLIETRADSEEELHEHINEITAIVDGFHTYVPFEFTEDPAIYSKYWAIRSGIFPSVGGMRRIGTTCLIEDVAFHIQDLPNATADLSDLLDKHGYDDSCIYGHALEGNFHFIINQSFDSQKEVDRYKAMIQDLVHMVVDKYDGSLKAEHGTGRNMAPFVKYEWGEKAYSLMKRVKALFDPLGILNPGVIFNDDPECYLRNFKALPKLNGRGDPKLEKINKCIECGFCEVNCVSCGFTMSARTRIVARREMERLRLLVEKGDVDAAGRLKRLKKEYAYDGDRTCAADGLCSMSCPMGINVADLTHEVRREVLPTHPGGRTLGVFAANHFAGVKSLIRFLLRTARLGQRVIGTKAMAGLCRWLHNALGIMLWTPSTPGAYNVPKALVSKNSADSSVAAASAVKAASSVDAASAAEAPLRVVYIPSCMNQMMGMPLHSPFKRSLVEETCNLLKKAGCEVIFPKNMDKLCCGTIWESKGMPDVAEKKLREMKNAIWEASEEGRLPVLCDQSPCLHHLRQHINDMKLYEPAEFIWIFLKNRLVFHQTDTPVPVHLTCSTRLMKIDETFVKLASLCSTKVIVPEGVGCCAFAGDKGMSYPELNKYALRKLRDQVKDCKVGYSNSRTCEIGLATNSGIPYVSIVYLVNSCTTPRP